MGIGRPTRKPDGAVLAAAAEKARQKVVGDKRHDTANITKSKDLDIGGCGHGQSTVDSRGVLAGRGFRISELACVWISAEARLLGSQVTSCTVSS